MRQVERHGNSCEICLHSFTQVLQVGHALGKSGVALEQLGKGVHGHAKSSRGSPTLVEVCARNGKQFFVFKEHFERIKDLDALATGPGSECVKVGGNRGDCVAQGCRGGIFVGLSLGPGRQLGLRKNPPNFSNGRAQPNAEALKNGRFS